MDWFENRLNHNLQSIDLDNTEFQNYLSTTQSRKAERSQSVESEENTHVEKETDKDSDQDMITEETEPPETNQKMDFVDQFIMKYSVEI